MSSKRSSDALGSPSARSEVDLSRVPGGSSPLSLRSVERPQAATESVPTKRQKTSTPDVDLGNYDLSCEHQEHDLSTAARGLQEDNVSESREALQSSTRSPPTVASDCIICMNEGVQDQAADATIVQQSCCSFSCHQGCLEEWYEHCKRDGRERHCPHCRAKAVINGVEVSDHEVVENDTEPDEEEEEEEEEEDEEEEDSDAHDSSASSATMDSSQRRRQGWENGWPTSDPRFWDLDCFDWPKYADCEYPTEEEHDRDTDCVWDSDPDDRRDPPYTRARSVRYRGIRYDPIEARELFQRYGCRCRRCHCPRCGRSRCTRASCLAYIAEMETAGQGGGAENDADVEKGSPTDAVPHTQQHEETTDIADEDAAGYDADNDD